MLAALASGAVTYQRARTPPIYTVTAVLRVTQGSVRTAADELAQGALREHIEVLTFTRPRLIELMLRHPHEFPGVSQDPDGAFENLQKRIALEIVGDDIIRQQADDAPRRSARISLGFMGSKPQEAWAVTHELADLLIDSALARQRAALLREQAGAEEAVDRAAQHADDTAVSRSEAVHIRLHTADERAVQARLAARAAEQGQTLRFELVDPGRMPAVVGKRAIVIGFFPTFAALLVAAALLAGAFDPRVLGGPDLQALRIPLLGELPPLPAGKPSPAEPAKPVG